MNQRLAAPSWRCFRRTEGGWAVALYGPDRQPIAVIDAGPAIHDAIGLAAQLKAAPVLVVGSGLGRPASARSVD